MTVAELIAWRHELHQHPELGFDENWTSAFVAERLRELGLEVHEGVGGTGVVAVLRGSGPEGRAIGLRAELDALAITEQGTANYRSVNDGCMHACGHDGHMAMLLGAAAALAKAEPPASTVYFLFQPAEEHGRGAEAMLRDGLIERFPMRLLFAMHNWPALPAGSFAMRAGPMMASEDNFKITIRGRGGHASSPHLCHDPVVPAAEVITALQSVISRSIDPQDTGVFSITDIRTDGIRNAIPSTVEITGDCRTFSSEVSNAIFARAKTIVENVARAHGCEGEIEVTHDFVALHNAPEAVALAIEAATAAVGSEKVDAYCRPATASDDFAAFLKQVPGAYVLIGNGGEAGSVCGLHNSRYDFDDQILEPGVRFWIELVAAFDRNRN